MPTLRVLISGASIAGPFAAYWFARTGAKVTVVERFSDLRPGGQNIDIRNIGVTVMRKVPGLEDVVRANLAPIEGFRMVREDGSTVAEMRPTGNPEQQTFVSEYEIYRGDLARIVYSLTADDDHVDYLFGEQIEAMTQQCESDDDSGTSGPVLVQFANGTASQEFDLVIACDGATSRTRALGLGCTVREHITPINAWAAYFTIKQDLIGGAKMGITPSFYGGRFMGVGPDTTPGCNRVTLIGVMPTSGKGAAEADEATLPFREAAKKGTEALKDYVADYYRGYGWKTEAVLQGLMESEDFYASELVQVKVPSLYKGRFVLVGDAGHAAGPTGTGTSTAMAAAYILAGEVSRHPGDLDAALRAYDERMKPIVKDMQKIPPGIMSFMGPQTRWGQWVRDMVFRVISWGIFFSGYFAWVGRWFGAGTGSDTYNIPDYEWTREVKQKRRE